jgi:cold shock protein
MRWALLSTDFEDGLKDRKQREARHQRNEAHDGQSNKRALDAIHLAEPRFFAGHLGDRDNRGINVCESPAANPRPGWRRRNALIRLMTRTNSADLLLYCKEQTRRVPSFD